MWKSIREWSSEFTSPFAEAMKEAFRVTLFAIPTQLIIWLEQPNFVWKTAIAGTALIFLRALDKYLYEKSKTKKIPVGEVVSGLSPI